MSRLQSFSEMTDQVVALIAEGATVSRAFNAIGIPPSTRTRWIRRGRGLEGPPSPECEELVRRVNEACWTSARMRAEKYQSERARIVRQREAVKQQERRNLEQEVVLLRAQLTGIRRSLKTGPSFDASTPGTIPVRRRRTIRTLRRGDR